MTLTEYLTRVEYPCLTVRRHDGTLIFRGPVIIDEPGPLIDFGLGALDGSYSVQANDWAWNGFGIARNNVDGSVAWVYCRQDKNAWISD